MAAKKWSYLALGDSYTIGEAVPLYDCFPYQAIQLLRAAGHAFHAPEIIAKTGWTTDELQQRMNTTLFPFTYDFVSLLIGVNNQYQGKPIGEYESTFERLVQKAIQLADRKPANVFVLSIPDWGVTPFAEGRDRKQIADEIDAYNNACFNITTKYGARYIDITPGTREAATDESLLARDKLHPSGKEYERWAKRLAEEMVSELQGEEYSTLNNQ